MSGNSFGINVQMKMQMDMSVIRVSQEERVAAIRTIGAHAPDDEKHRVVEMLGLDDEFRP